MVKLNINKGYLSIYKKNLIDEGIINIKNRGEVEFTLPRFDKFIKLRQELYED